MQKGLATGTTPSLKQRKSGQLGRRQETGLDRATTRLLKTLMVQFAKSNGRIVLPRRIKSGAILVWHWKGQSHRVTVLENSFAYQGKAYESLSEIARLITGTRWNGPKFFGLRAAKD
jgi:hypothetical protein